MSTEKRKEKLSASQIEAMEFMLKNKRVFYRWNCYLKQQTIKSLMRLGLIKEDEDDKYYIVLTDLGKKFETLQKK